MVEESTPEKKLYDAAAVGNVETFQQVLHQNPHLEDVVSFPCLKNVLHIAIKQGEGSLVEEVLRINPELAQDLDSKNSSSLHIAATQGKVEIVEKLLAVAPRMCWWRDAQDMNPVHIAAMNGHEDVLKKLLEQDPLPAMERVYRGQTVLHLCVKHRQLGALKVLAKKLGDLVSAKDDDGETILHLAVRSNQLEIIQYLVQSCQVEKLTTNSMGNTAMDIVDECPLENKTYFRMKRIFRLLQNQLLIDDIPKWNDTIMVVAVLIATMAFQAAVSPPGGVWQDDTSSHSAGKAVMASSHPTLYKHFSRANTTAFVSSLVTILLAALGGQLFTYVGQLIHAVLLAIASYAMWLSMASIGVSYGVSLMMTNPMQTPSIVHIVSTVVSVFIVIFGFTFLYAIAVYWLRTWKRTRRQHGEGASIKLCLAAGESCFARLLKGDVNQEGHGEVAA